MDGMKGKKTYICEIIDRTARYFKNQIPVNIIISGMSCSGKTTLAKNICEMAPGNAVVIHQDDYFKNLEDLPRYNGFVSCDGLAAFRTEKFVSDSCAMMGFMTIKGPLYEIANNRIVSDNAVCKKPELIRVYEGLHANLLLCDNRAEGTPPVVGEKIHIHLQPGYDECLRRRIERDGKMFGMPAEKVKMYFDEVVWPVYKEYDNRQATICDYLIIE